MLEGPSSTVAIVCGSIALSSAVLLGLLAWLLLNNKEGSSMRAVWPWRQRAATAAGVPDARTQARGSPAGVEQRPITPPGGKPADGGPAHVVPFKAAAVVVIQPDESAWVGLPHEVFHTELGCSAAGAISTARCSPTAAGPSTPRTSTDHGNTSSAASITRVRAEMQRAAYLAELEEREAARQEAVRHNAGMCGSPSGWAYSFLPFVVL